MDYTILLDENDNPIGCELVETTQATESQWLWDEVDEWQDYGFWTPGEVSSRMNGQ